MLFCRSILLVIILIVLDNIQQTTSTFSNEWLVRADVSLEEADALAIRHGFGFVEQLYEGHFLMINYRSPRASKHKDRRTLKRLTGEIKVASAEQQQWLVRNLRDTSVFSVQDPKWAAMWYINNHGVSPDIGVHQSWIEGYNGTGVSIAIVDDGVDHQHPDLRERYDSSKSKDVYDSDKEPKPSAGESHGTKCAGVALATKNKECILGVGYQSSLVAIRLIGYYGTTDIGEYRALASSGVDIFSNSWGASDKSPFTGPGEQSLKGIYEGITKGRGGLGSIYVFAGGNGGFDDNCNCDGYISSIYTIGINSVTRTKEPPTYAEPCTAILASAYSGPGGSSDNVCTTDLRAACTCSFSGTSAATPMAAGILSLALQANPTLSWRDMQHLIVRTSNPTGLLYGDFKLNGVGRKVSDMYGYGMLDANKLIKEAKHWKTTDPQHTCSTPIKTVNGYIKAHVKPRTTDSSIFTDGCNATSHCVDSIEHIEVWISVSSSLRGAIQLLLTSPTGTQSKLLTRRNGDETKNSKQEWTYMSVQHWDEETIGEWKLTFSLSQDYVESGSLNSWYLKFHGTGSGCSINSTESTDSGGNGTCLPHWIYVLIATASILICAFIIMVIICMKHPRTRKSCQKIKVSCECRACHNVCNPRKATEMNKTTCNNNNTVTNTSIQGETVTKSPVTDSNMTVVGSFDNQTFEKDF